MADKKKKADDRNIMSEEKPNVIFYHCPVILNAGIAEVNWSW